MKGRMYAPSYTVRDRVRLADQRMCDYVDENGVNPYEGHTMTFRRFIKTADRIVFNNDSEDGQSRSVRHYTDRDINGFSKQMLLAVVEELMFMLVMNHANCLNSGSIVSV